MKELFEFKNYKEFVGQRLKSRERGGHGQFARLAATLGTSPVTVSQIFRGKRDLSADQALSVAEFLELGPLELRYFLLLVEENRAQTPRLRAHLRAELGALRAKSQDIKQRVPSGGELNEEQRARFYSDWIYSAVRLSASLPSWRGAAALAQELGREPAQITQALEFLQSTGLLVSRGGRFELGTQSTHLGSDSPWIAVRQAQWRNLGMRALERRSREDLFYSAPVSISAHDYAEFRRELVNLVERFATRVTASPAEELACLNIDYFRV